MAGYSSTQRAKKLGYKHGLTVTVHPPPGGYVTLLALDDTAAIGWSQDAVNGIQLMHAFTTRLAELKKLLPSYRQRIVGDGCPKSIIRKNLR